jgi:hypothetical protein
MIELEHSPLGGSSAHRFISCFGSFLLHREQLQAGTFEEIESEYAKLGTAAHELCAKAVETATEPYEFLGEEFSGYLAGWPEGLSLDAAQIYFNLCMSVLDKAPEDGSMFLETTIHLPEIHPLLRGTVDFGHYHQKTLATNGVWLIDYKNGEGIGVRAAGNLQLLYYGFLLVMNDKWLRAAPRDTAIHLAIVQPNFYGLYEEPEVWITTIGEVMDWGHNTLLPVMNELMIRKGYVLEDFVTGEHCQFCPVMLECPKMQKAFADYAAAEEDFIAMLTNEELDALYANRENVRRFMTALENTVYARKIGGQDIKSAKLVEKRSNRVWKPGAEAALKAAFGEKAYSERKVKSPAQVEKLSSRGKEIALEWGFKPEAHSLTIAPITDPRPEAKPRSNATTFANFEQSPEDLGF